MARRTLADARRSLEGNVLPSASDYQAREYQQVLGAAEERAKARATEYLTEGEAEVRAVWDEALRELAAVRDAYDDLKSEGGLGRIPAAQYSAELNDLRQRQDRAEAALRDAETRVGAIEQIEEDPIAWYSDLQRRMPHLQEEVPW